ncbi:MAG: MarC family protein [Flavihumibacter sp.]
MKNEQAYAHTEKYMYFAFQMDNLHTFLQLMFFSLIALFPVVNPVGTAFIVSPYFSGLSDKEKKVAVKKITLNAFCICAVTVFVGHWVLEIFGLSIPIIQLAGGIMICKMGWDSLSDDKEPDHPSAISTTSPFENLKGKLFYPITFPITTGAGTISVLFTLSAHSAKAGIHNYFINTGAVLLAVVCICILIYILYLNTKRFIQFFGSKGEKIINRIFSFLIFCVGLQIAVSGIKTLMAGPTV